MDHTYSLERPTAPLSPDLAEKSARVASFLAGGGRGVVLSGPKGAGKSAIVDQLVAGTAGRVLRISNQGHGPLDLAAMLHQLGQAPVEEADEQGLFLRTLAAMAYEDYSAVLAVEDAHTLTGFALSALSRVPGLGGPDLPGMILVLSGEPALLAKLAAPGLEQLRNSRRTLLLKLPGGARPHDAPAPTGADVGSVAEPLGHLDPAPRRGRRQLVARDLRLVALAAVAGGVLTGGWFAWQQPWVATQPLASFESEAASPPPATVQRTDAPSEPGPTSPPGPAASAPEVPSAAHLQAPPGMPAASPARLPALPGPPIPDAPAPGRSAEALRREFNAFLDRSGRDTAALTPAKRDVLFQDYLRWNARSSARPAAGP